MKRTGNEDRRIIRKWPFARDEHLGERKKKRICDEVTWLRSWPPHDRDRGRGRGAAYGCPTTAATQQREGQ